jgi:hypothetical protein
MKFFNLSDKEVPVHQHPTDETCHWINVFKPLAYVIFYTASLRPLIKVSGGSKLTEEEYCKWLCQVDTERKTTNLVKLLVDTTCLVPLPYIDV